jgi:light-regulated signal transduction histidine kinase (bacteriophytochrome)
MKPLKSELQDAENLCRLGSASVQIVHDLKNQLNGLKLYATFLKKRFEKSDRPADESETIAKIITGLERAAADMTVLVRHGRPLEIRRQANVDLERMVSDAVGNQQFEVSGTNFEGDFDPNLLGEALKTIVDFANKSDGNAPSDGDHALTKLTRDFRAGGNQALIEWVLPQQNALVEDVFNSFAGSRGLRMALASKIIRAHDGAVEQESRTLRVRLPLK